MTTIELMLLILAVFVSGILSCMIGKILAHLLLYPRRRQTGKRKGDRINEAFINLIKHS